MRYLNFGQIGLVVVGVILLLQAFNAPLLFAAAVTIDGQEWEELSTSGTSSSKTNKEIKVEEDDELWLEPDLEEEIWEEEGVFEEETSSKEEASKKDGKSEQAVVEDAEEWIEEDLEEDWEEGWQESDENIQTFDDIQEAFAESEQIPSVLTNLDECKRVALLTNKRVQVAIKEMKYERHKLVEAERDFLPQVKGNWEKQEGSSAQEGQSKDDTGFSGLKYGLEAQQILFNSGKLSYQLEQAKTKLLIAKKKYLQAKQEAIYDVEKAYYELVKAQMAFEIQADLSKSAEAALSYAREAYRQGVNTYHEFLNVQSQTDQTYYQLLSSQQDIALAELELRQKCNVDASIGIQINAVLTFTDFEFNYSLDECLELAFKNRPDLAVNELTTLADVYGIKMSMAEGLPKIEFLGNVGKNGQSKAEEELKLNDEWSAKVQATWVIGANSVQYYYENKKTVPTEFGEQDNVKDSKTQNLTVSLFDKLENFSNLAKEYVTKSTSEADLVELRGKVAKEVEENYFNYQKAMTMVTASLSEIKFKEKDLEVNRAKQMMEDVQLSQVLTSELQLGEERVNYVQALSDYYTSISGLFKAMGLSK